MSPFSFVYFTIMFILGLFASLSHDSFGNAAAVERSQKAVFKKGLRHQKPARRDSSAALPRNSSSRKQQRLFDFSPKKEDYIALHTSFTSTVVRRQEEDAELQCEDNQSLFRVEVTTDNHPGEISWELVNVSSGAVMMGYGFFSYKQERIYVEEKCLESKLCYQFTIYHYYHGDGLEPPGGGSYSVEYGNELIKEGEGDFGNKEESELFGDGCESLQSSTPTNSQKPTAFPSRMPSAHRTNSQKPTVIPSCMPSAHPSNSQKPTEIPSTSSNPSLQPSFPPSFSPSASFEPTSSPTEFRDFISYSKDGFDRRYFPSMGLSSCNALLS